MFCQEHPSHLAPSFSLNFRGFPPPAYWLDPPPKSVVQHRIAEVLVALMRLCAQIPV